MLTMQDLEIRSLGEPRYASPLGFYEKTKFVSDGTRILYRHEIMPDSEPGEPVAFEKAGPRKDIFFDPRHTTAAIVTCGGLSPGLNNVIRSVYRELTLNYGVKRVLGIRNGYAGLNPQEGAAPLRLDVDSVDRIHHLGGTILGSSRGPQEVSVMADFMDREQIDILFCIGGDGTQRGAHALTEEMRKRDWHKSIIGIPKTIDNDIAYVWMTFGYATALEKAAEVLRAAHVEATCAPNGVALVKLMGRDAGFIAAAAALASQEANFVLVPEVRFPLDGENGFLAALQRRLADRGHALVVVAEGAGQHLFEESGQNIDASGNVKHHDVGLFLRDRIKDHFKERSIPLNLKYMDPSYLIRSIPANAWDRILCDQLARHSVHAAMAGKTDLVIGSWHTEFIHVPISTVVQSEKRMGLASQLWTGVLACTGQPHWASAKEELNEQPD